MRNAPEHSCYPMYSMGIALFSRLAINVRTNSPARGAVRIEGAVKIFPCQLFGKSLGVFSHQSSEFAWL